ncbi:MAG: biotin/lipoyl-containing protein [Pseudomonadota bacterium]
MSKMQNREMEYSLTYRDALEILQLIKATEFCESLDLQFGDLKLVVRRGAAAAVTAPAQPAAAADSELITVRAPSLGIFHRKACVDDVVATDDAVGLLGVMQQLTPIPAGVSGRIVEILVDDGVLVEYGQAVAVIEPR